MTGLLYLAAVLGALGCMLLVDRRWRLVLWADPRRAVVVLAVAFVFFLAWDVAAIGLGHYRRGGSSAMTGIEVAPELPLEELVFIVFLGYQTLVLYAGVDRLLPPGGRRNGALR